ncbi:MAG: Cell wall endopeptidase, family M23/M37 [Berkelbacteria bacterium GW2011_GWB1_38_5]|uniref:Cell wall endopeptidase, family M23/M37 n=1 Tax=Berkelbacteria bacterium GW2011_GWB1_38_5 TaxID=1618336 RepID=A0A0G0KE42_9BACT|nr:MAG: Cell wall endopeptidase, family M23/M37 [Berkelbacteria bacterium GW2011_GWB1_38_5]
MGKKIRNRIPDSLIDFSQRKLLPYLAIIIIAGFTVIADIAKAAENSSVYVPSEEVMDISPADVAQVVSVVGPYTTKIDEDPLTVALAMENKDFLGKPVLASTEITAQPQVQKAPEKRTKTITYTVEGSDTLSSIAWKYGLKIASVKAVNSLTSDMIRPGQQLRLPPQDVDPSTINNLQKKKVAGASITAFAGTFRRPTSGFAMSQPFGHTSFENFHDGIDLDSRSGTTLFAAASGRVVSVTRGWGGGFGNHIEIDHGGGFKTLYGHMASFSVSSGQMVNQGQVIGKMGNTGWSTGTHVHFRITINGRAVNPLSYL